FEGLNFEEIVWMSHGDSVATLPSPLQAIASSESGLIAAICHSARPQYGVQFHPEVTHTPCGAKLLHNFISLCGISQKWTMDQFLHLSEAEIKERVGTGKIVSLVSGGIDSTFSTLLCSRALGPENVFPIHIDTGLMRHKESEEICD